MKEFEILRFKLWKSYCVNGSERKYHYGCDCYGQLLLLVLKGTYFRYMGVREK